MRLFYLIDNSIYFWGEGGWEWGKVKGGVSFICNVLLF